MYDIFQLPSFSFPDEFLWGSSISGHQTEGYNIHSDRWAREQKQLAENPDAEVSGAACNHYELYKEDTQLLKTLGHKAFRTSVEWSRIEPSEGHFDAKELEHYISEFSYLKEQGITVFCTLVHGSVPLWFFENGGFCKTENLKYFERYLNYVLPALSPYVDFWNVLNEFNYGRNNAEELDFKINSLKFHALGYHTIKKYSDKPVSSAHAFVEHCPLRAYDKFDKIMTDVTDWQNNEFFFHAIRTGEILYPFRNAEYDESIKDTADFWSINTYTREMITARTESASAPRFEHKQLKMIPKKFYYEEMYPECLVSNLTRLTDKPVYITENGCSCDNDDFRIVNIALYLSALSECIRLGVDVRGYLYWSTFDNYEWSSWLPKFGLCSIDRKTFEKKIKPSGYFYKDIIENNGLNTDIIKKYLHSLPTTL